MGDLFLSEEEIAELTGKRRTGAQKAVLDHVGITHKTRPDNSLIVLRSHMEAVLGGESRARPKPAQEPNWAAMREASKPRRKPG
jgi:hypothetical protein